MKSPPFEKSFASFDDQEKLSCWSKKNILKPEQVSKGSSKNYIFDCKKCKHEFSARLSKVSGNTRRWCNYCGNKKLCEDINCKICYEKSFQYVLDIKKFVLWYNINNNLKTFKK